MEKFFQLKANNTSFGREVIAGLSTFLAMSYIIFVLPNVLGQSGMPVGGVYLATIIATVIGTLIMALFANVPYALAPGMGLSAFFTYTVVFSLGFSWQEALAMVFLCGLINIFITVTKVRKMLIFAIPESLQSAIGGGIGFFVAYIGIKGSGLLQFIASPNSYIFNVQDNPSAGLVANSSVVPELVRFNNPAVLLALAATLLLIVLIVLKVKGAVLITIVAVTLAGMPFGVTKIDSLDIAGGISQSFSQLGDTVFAAFGEKGMGALLSNPEHYLTIIMAVFAFSLSDTFDTIGTFIGTGRHTGIFTFQDDIAAADKPGFKTKLDRALFADSIATSLGAVLGTSNTTTYVESSVGIEAGGRTGLTSVVTSLCFLLCIPFASLVSIIPSVATAPVLLIVGIMMLASLKLIDWSNLEESVPAFFATLFMAVAYNVTYGIAFAFFAHLAVKVAKGQAKTVHPLIWIISLLFALNFIIMSII